jgi:hypothetical protein
MEATTEWRFVARDDHSSGRRLLSLTAANGGTRMKAARRIDADGGRSLVTRRA